VRVGHVVQRKCEGPRHSRDPLGAKIVLLLRAVEVGSPEHVELHEVEELGERRRESPSLLGIDRLP
jgi:hypothetical protein